MARLFNAAHDSLLRPRRQRNMRGSRSISATSWWHIWAAIQESYNSIA